MSADQPDEHKNTQENMRYAVVGALGGAFAGVAISALTGAVGVAAALSTPLSFVLILAGAAIGFLS